MADTKKKEAGEDSATTTTVNTPTRGEKTWYERFQQLKQYKVKHGHPNPDPTKRRGVDREDYKLALWLDSQRMKSREGSLELALAQKLVFLGCKSIDIHILKKKLTPKKPPPPKKDPSPEKINNNNSNNKRSRSTTPEDEEEEEDDYEQENNKKTTKRRRYDDDDDDDDDEDDEDEEEEEIDLEEEYIPGKQTNKKKKKRVYYSGGNSGGSTYVPVSNANRKRVSWETRFDELVAFNKEHGHANPKYGKDKPLAQWLSNQRSDYRCGKRKKLTLDKIQKLRDLGASGFGND